VNGINKKGVEGSGDFSKKPWGARRQREKNLKCPPKSRPDKGREKTRGSRENRAQIQGAPDEEGKAGEGTYGLPKD